MADQAQTIQTLSKRESEVAAAYADGDSYKVIARNLGISPTTVRSHLRTVYGKLKVTSKIALAQALADPTPSKSQHDDDANLIAELALELDDAMRRERMMARVLNIISQKGVQLDRVIDEVLDHALEICEAEFGILFENHGNLTFSEMRSRHIPTAFSKWLAEQGVFTTEAETGLGQVAATLKPINIADMRDDGIEQIKSPLRIATVDLGKARSFAAIPMMSGNQLIGVFTVYRNRVHPFNDRSLELAQAFADQAAIAIENARQKGDMQTRLGQAAATREILEGINNTRDNEAPVFETILRNAATLCSSPMARLELADSARQTFRCVASWGEEMRSFDVGEVMPLSMSNDLPTAIRDGVVRHIHDLAKTELYLSGDPIRTRMVDEEGYRTYLIVPLISSSGSIGAIVLCRREVAPFSDEQIALVETFAAQAVIALENANQFNSLQARVEQAVATREILDAISSASDDDDPVFQAIVSNASKLCGDANVALHLTDHKRTHATYVAGWGDPTKSFEVGVSNWSLDDRLPLTDAIREGKVINVFDADDYASSVEPHPDRAKFINKDNIQSQLVVPLLAKGQSIGCLELYRRERKPFSDEEVNLVETFAQQAVIALENVRQFSELDARLQRAQTTRNILDLIRDSRADEKPVFEVITQSAVTLCNAQFCMLWRYEGGLVHYCASYGFTREFMEQYLVNYPMQPEPNGIAYQVIESGTTIHLKNAQAEPYIDAAVARQHGYEYMVGVPIKANDGVWGVMVLAWPKDRIPDSNQIELLETFSSQGGIAIENARQIKSLQSRLDQAKATREILDAISSASDDESPVFDTILRNARSLCDAPFAALILGREADGHQSMIAHHGAVQTTEDIYREGRVPMDPEKSFAARAIIEKRPIHLPNMKDTDQYRAGIPSVVELCDLQGIRTNLFVPLIKDGEGIGCFIIFRHEVRPYSEEQISLVETFAAQAVIALENVRQFKALEDLNAELGNRVQEQVAEIERMSLLKRFLPPAVADTVVSQGSEKMLASHRALLGVLFCDIRGFTAFCESAEPEETIEVLQTYHQQLGKLINDHGAGVDHRMGDGIMVLFNDPLPCEDPAGDAVRLAIAMQTKMAELCKKWKRLGHRLGFGVGVSLGYATVGLVGHEGRFDYTASGTAVNVAARLCDEAADGEILLSAKAAVAVEDNFKIESRGELSLKGVREPVEVFRLESCS